MSTAATQRSGPLRRLLRVVASWFGRGQPLPRLPRPIDATVGRRSLGIVGQFDVGRRSSSDSVALGRRVHWRGRALAVRSVSDCEALIAEMAREYVLGRAWEIALDAVLPPLASPIRVGRHSFYCCVGMTVDAELGAHFLFDDGNDLEELLLREVTFTAAPSKRAQRWLKAHARWCARLALPRRVPARRR